MTPGVYVGVDVGGGGVRVRADAAGQPFDNQDRSPVPRKQGKIDAVVLADRIGALVRPLQRVDRAIDRVAVGLTGMPELLDVEVFVRAVREHCLSRSTVVATDGLTTHLGALGGEAGTVVSAGTGVVASATDFSTVWRRGDGWGHLVGDEGSGAWIGAAGIRAALRAVDGRAEASPELLADAKSMFGGTDGLIARVYGGTAPAHELAAFAPVVAAAAREGDVVATDIWRRAGILLAETAHAASVGIPPRHSWGGKLFDAGELLLDPFRQELLRREPSATVEPPRGQSADGALMLAKRGLGEAAGLLDGYAREIGADE